MVRAVKYLPAAALFISGLLFGISAANTYFTYRIDEITEPLSASTEEWMLKSLNSDLELSKEQQLAIEKLVREFVPRIDFTRTKLRPIVNEPSYVLVDRVLAELSAPQREKFFAVLEKKVLLIRPPLLAALQEEVALSYAHRKAIDRIWSTQSKAMLEEGAPLHFQELLLRSEEEMRKVMSPAEVERFEAFKKRNLK